MRPLEGLFVLDFSTLLPGPMASLLLAEAGAEVVKVERPGRGEEMRSYQPRWGSDSVNFALLNRGKRSVALDLKSEEGLKSALSLAARADVVLEQFRPGVMAKLGLDYETLRAVNPGVIYCSITGYGQTGPKSLDAGHDLNYIADTGLLALSMGAAGHRTVPPALIADIAGGAYPAVMNILLALEERRRTGVGRSLDVSMADNMFPFMYWAMGNGLVAGQWPGNGSDLVTGGSPRYRLYETADGRVVAAAPLEDKFWDAFCTTIDLPAAIRDDRPDPEATAAAVAGLIKAHDADHWTALFAAADCCCTVVASLGEAMENPHFKERAVFAHRLVGRSGSELPALPVPIDPAFRLPVGAALRAPELGSEHRDRPSDVRAGNPT